MPIHLVNGMREVLLRYLGGGLVDVHQFAHFPAQDRKHSPNHPWPVPGTVDCQERDNRSGMLQQGMITNTSGIRADLLVCKLLPVHGVPFLFCTYWCKRMLRESLIEITYDIAGVLNGFIVMRQDW